MKLTEAIEINQLALDTGIVNDPNDFRTASKIILEAGKHCQRLRSDKHCDPTKLLPGETKE